MILSRVLFNNLYRCDKCVTAVNFHKRTDYRSIVSTTLLTNYFAKPQQITSKRTVLLNCIKNGPAEEEFCTTIFVIRQKYPTNADLYKDTSKTNNLHTRLLFKYSHELKTILFQRMYITNYIQNE